MFSRSKVLPLDTTMPRAELIAAALNAATGFTVRKAFGNYHKKAFKFSDSKVALHWIGGERKVLKTYVIEIRRLNDVSDWGYAKSSDMPADLGTRQKAKVTDVMEGSPWINGLSWMSKPGCDFPT